MESVVQSIWKRSKFAEGNPMHVSFTRISIKEEGMDTVQVLHDGIVESFDWHRDKQVTARKGAGDSPEDRALLIQTKENLKRLKEIFPEVATFEINSSFGENLLIEGNLGPKTLCVGDVLHFKRRNEIVCAIKITSPRWPCYKIDMKHSKTLNHLARKDRVRAICGEAGLGGFFCKVVQEGTVAFGDQLVLAERYHPKWTMERLSEVFYGGTNRENCAIDVFQGSEEELEELLHLEDLATFEWRDRLEKYVEKKQNPEPVPENKGQSEATEAEPSREIKLHEKKESPFLKISVYVLLFTIFIFIILY